MVARARSRRSLLYGGIGALALGAALALIPPSSDRATAKSGSFVRDGEAGFIVTQFAYALGPDADQIGACPNGMSKDVVQIFGETPAGQRLPGEGDEEYSERLEAGGKAISTAPDGRNFCLHPQIAPHDPHTRFMISANAPAEGIDLDGINSRSAADARANQLDFVGVDGAKGVDNQFWRAVGCSRSFQSTGQSNAFATEMYTGSWGIVITLGDVDDPRNDDHVEVGIHANGDPIQLSPTREALEYASYTPDQDPAFRATTTGKIKDGVLITEPVDVRFRNVVNAMHLQRPLRDARIRAELSPDGVLKGFLAGYAPVDDLYNVQFGYRNGRNADGSPAALQRRLGSSNGAARALGYTCQGIYQSLNRLADGHQDPKTGRFTSLSTQFRFEARPAFVVDSDSPRANEEIARND